MLYMERRKKKRKKRFILYSSSIMGLLILMGFWHFQEDHSISTKTKIHHTAAASTKELPTVNTKKVTTKKSAPVSLNDLQKTQSGALDVSHLTNNQWLKLVEKTDFKDPSDGSYPQITNWSTVWIDANITQQRIYIKQGNQTLYTMLTSSGLDTIPDNSTPLGTYYVQAEKGTSFYSPQYKEGAEYWTSWKNHGEFLFHSIPVDQNGNPIKRDAERLGKKDSHGCFHLTFADAKWIYENVPTGTKVVIHN